MSNSFDQDQPSSFAWIDLGPNYLQMLSAADISHIREERANQLKLVNDYSLLSPANDKAENGPCKPVL